MSPFLARPTTDHIAGNLLAFALRDAFPVSPGHTLVIPRRLVATWFEATRDEQLALLELVDAVKADLDRTRSPDGYNVGFNAGAAAGQTVAHLHVHVIPRYAGDVDDPRGGVRHVIPGKGNYLAPTLATGGENDPFGHHVLPLLERSRDVRILAAFVQESGLVAIEHALHTALGSGARVRLLTGDYLDLTQASALELLLDWQSTGDLKARVVEVGKLKFPTRSFHPKAWHLAGDGFEVAFVGSSNLSRSALESGIEWNLRAHAPGIVREAFDGLWDGARPLDAAWVAAYARRARLRPLPLPLPFPGGEIEPDAVATPPEPHEVQQEALEALRTARAAGRRRALVVLATGLGKTWLAAFDFAQLWDALGRQPRLLFVAHRREILRQAAGTFRALVHARGGDARVGWCFEDRAELDAPLVFASVAKLARLDPDVLAFDYVVIDEVHHAAAKSYRRILAAVDPAFLLGLTATPDRADAADIEGLFDDFVAYRADIGRGIDVGRLVPFRYWGVKDSIDYANLPWRNRKFDADLLASAAQTEARMATLWASWAEHPAARSLVFCCSVAHTDYVADWLGRKGVRVAKVYASPGGTDRDEALAGLRDGTFDAILAIDVFNEGVDVPGLDRVILLRPTESRVVFLQQLGRGLRAAPGKSHLTVIDFVGNHAMFLDRLRALLSLGGAAAHLGTLVDTGHLDLPDGCSVDLQLEAKTLLEARFRGGGTDEVERIYRDLRTSRGARPTAGELYRLGHSLTGIRARHGSWFDFVVAEGDLADVPRDFLRELEVTPMTRSFKMVTLQVLLDADALSIGLPVSTIAERAWTLLDRSPELLKDVPEAERDPATWVAYWRRKPIAAWTSGKWFRLDDDRLHLVHPSPPDLVRELVDLRLAQYRRRERVTEDGFVCGVGWSGRDPILKLPARHPLGEVDVRLADGAVWTFRFAKEYCNVARPAGTSTNALPDLLRRWFGPRAGQPGTAYDVRFTASPDGLWAEPVQGAVVVPLHAIAAYPDLRAAAGHVGDGVEAPEQSVVYLPIEPSGPDRFAVRVSGTSMDGGKAPIRDGDWAIFELARGMRAGAIEGRVALVEVPALGEGSAYQVKRVVREGQVLRRAPSGMTPPSALQVPWR